MRTRRPVVGVSLLVATVLALGGCTSLSSDRGTAEEQEADGSRQAATSRDRIARALAAGEIDEATALLYRVYARFDDPELPERFRGDAPSGHDPSLFSTIHRRIDDLPPDVAAALRPYLLRPTHPDSAFTGAAETSTEAQPALPGGPMLLAAGAAAGDRGAPALVGAADTSRACTQGWDSLALTGGSFRVWICATGDWEADLDALSEASDAVDTHWDEMTQPVPGGMGRPIRDDPAEDPHPDADDRIDIYLLGEGSLLPERFDGDAFESSHGVTQAEAVPTEPIDGVTSSGYLLVDRGAIGDGDELERVLIHEMFHLLQFAHNESLAPEMSWFVEGSAMWAETYYAREDSAQVHRHWFSGAQTRPQSLVDVDPWERPYEAYTWLLFMEQQEGAQSIFAAWEELGSPTCAGGRACRNYETSMKAVAQQVDFEAFPSYALRMLNADLPGDPITPRFVELDPNFPDDHPPPLDRMDRVHQLDIDEDVEIDYETWHVPDAPEGVPGLSFRHDRVEVAQLEEGSSVEVRPDGLADHGVVSLIALLRDPDTGSYRQRPIDLVDGASLCAPDELYLILSNRSTDAEDLASGTVTLEVSQEPVCALAGDIRVSFTGEYRSPPDQIPYGDTHTMRFSGVIEVETGPRETESRPALPPLPTSSSPPDPPEEEILYAYYPDDGSSVDMHGSYRYECWSSTSVDCPYWAEEEYAASGSLAAAGGDLRVVIEDGEVRLEVSVPVEVSWSTGGGGQPTRTGTSQTTWHLSCWSGGFFWPDAPASWWEESGRYSHGHLPGGGSAAALSGTWTDDSHTAVGFDCHETWQPRTYGPASGEESSATFTAEGTIRAEDP